MTPHRAAPSFLCRPLSRSATTCAIALLAAHAGHAAETGGAAAGEWKAGVRGGVSYGIGVRTSNPDPELLFVNNAPQVGLSSPNTAGRNQDDGNLNFRKGDVYSNVAKGFADLTMERKGLRALVRVQAWYDFRLEDGGVPWGHTPNGLAPDQPLSDDGARARGKFANAIFSNVQLAADFAPGGRPLTAIVGLQNIGWRGMGLLPGPLAVLDPLDAPARARPGAFAEEGSIPVPALRLRFKPAEAVTLDGFLQLGFRANQGFLCGTFPATADRTLDGCDKTMVHAGAGTMTDRQLLAANRVVRLSSIDEPGGSGQFGLSGRWAVDKKTEWGLAFARYHSRQPFTNMVKSQIPGANPFAPLDPRNPSTRAVYPEGIRTLALDVKTEAASATWYGSLSHTPNQPLGYAGGEVFQAFVAPVATANLFRALERATAPGGVFQGWDRRRTSDLQIGAIRPLRNTLGAATLALRAELNAKYVHDLPDPTELRYARPEVFGSGPINGSCPAGTSPVVCSNDGYTSRFAWGYVLRAAASYPKAFAGVDLRPSIGFQHNVRGWSWDGSLREGRKTLLLGLDAVHGATVFGLNVVHNSSSTYDNTRDRNFLTLSVATRF